MDRVWRGAMHLIAGLGSAGMGLALLGVAAMFVWATLDMWVF